jgi:hypothetical protein
MIRNKIGIILSITIFFSIGLTIFSISPDGNNLVFGQIQSNQNTNNSSSSSLSNYKYTATLIGNEQVPPVTTNGIGSASFEILEDNNILHYQVNILDVPNITGIHIHQGKSGQNGDVLVSLYNPKENNIFKLGNNNSISQTGNISRISQIDSSSMTINGNKQNSFMISGTINNSDLKGPLEGKQISDLITLMNDGNTYVNVHSESYTDGEIRGQIE